MIDEIESIDHEKLRIEIEKQLKYRRRNVFIDYCDYVHRGNWRKTRHLEYVCKRVQDVIDGKIKRLMVFLPPRHGKSMSITETLPSFFLGKNPDKRVIVSSYSSELAQRFGRRNRQKIEEFGKELFDVEISQEKASQVQWEIKDRLGGMLSVGVGGSVTGSGGDLIILDDPIKNRLEAESLTYRERLWQEWQNTIRTRLQPDGAIIIILTRWHNDDLAGRLMNPEFGEVEDWHVISLPAIAEENDLLNRKPGEALCPELGFGAAWAEETKSAVGTYTWAALYQQRPSPLEGALIKRDWWRYYDQLPSCSFIIQSWDCTFKDLKTSDFVVGQVWGMQGANRYLLDQVRGRMGITETMNAIRIMSEKWQQTAGILIEDKANGTAVIELLSMEIPGLIPVEPHGGKIVRAQAVTPMIEAGNVFLPSPARAPWILDFIEECAVFPNGKNDDQVDAMTQSLTRLKDTFDLQPGQERSYTSPIVHGNMGY